MREIFRGKNVLWHSGCVFLVCDSRKEMKKKPPPHQCRHTHWNKWDNTYQWKNETTPINRCKNGKLRWKRSPTEGNPGTHVQQTQKRAYEHRQYKLLFTKDEFMKRTRGHTTWNIKYKAGGEQRGDFLPTKTKCMDWRTASLRPARPSKSLSHSIEMTINKRRGNAPESNKKES